MLLRWHAEIVFSNRTTETTRQYYFNCHIAILRLMESNLYHFVMKVNIQIYLNYAPCKLRGNGSFQTAFQVAACLTHWGRVTHIFVINLAGHYQFRQWFVACSAPRHYLNQCSIIFNWTLRSKLQSNCIFISNTFIQDNVFENAVWKCEIFCLGPNMSLVVIRAYRCA